MPTLLIVQIAGGRPFDDRFNRATIDNIERPGPTRATSIMLETMITTRGSDEGIGVQEVSSGENRLNTQPTRAFSA